MSTIKVSNIGATAVPTPGAGQVAVFADSSNSDNLSMKNSSGTVYDLTSAGTPADSIPTKEVKITLTPAQILALDTTPIQVVSAPDAGKVLVPVRVFSKLRFGTTAYVGGSARLRYIGGDQRTHESMVLTATGDSSGFWGAQGAGPNDDIVKEAAGLELYSTGAFTTGDSEIDIYVTYTEMTL